MGAILKFLFAEIHNRTTCDFQILGLMTVVFSSVQTQLNRSQLESIYVNRVTMLTLVTSRTTLVDVNKMTN